MRHIEQNGLADGSALQALRDDPRFAELAAHRPRLSILRILDRQRHEVSHSRLLAHCLDPHSNSLAEPILRHLLGAVAQELTLRQHPHNSVFFASSAAPFAVVRVRRELARIDVVIEVGTAQGTVVLGIENKIDAGEQDGQVGRYQAALHDIYGGRPAVLVFLAPAKRTPFTENAQSPVPCVPLGYEVVLAALDAALETSASTPKEARRRCDRHALAELAAHIEEEIMGDPQSAQLARSLWATHGRALRLALAARPKLSDIRVAYEGALTKRFGSDARITRHPEQRGDLLEIKLALKSWGVRGYPFTFMLYADDDGLPNVRVFAASDQIETKATALKAWADRVNALKPGLVDPAFRPVNDWDYWRRVFDEESYPDSARLVADQYDAATVDEAIAKVIQHYEELRPFIER